MGFDRRILYRWGETELPASSLSDLVEHNRFGDDKRRSGL
jgi:hypothetical protein